MPSQQSQVRKRSANNVFEDDSMSQSKRHCLGQDRTETDPDQENEFIDAQFQESMVSDVVKFHFFLFP